jgi:dienelactone hydrolase
VNGVWRKVASGLAALHLLGCATPSESVVDRLQELKFSVTTVTGTKYRHLVAQAEAADHGPIHIYVEHDGVPWVRPDVVSSDPTPRYPLALEMMARDEGNRVYLGRPCYFGLKDDLGCSARLWTDARYSDEVVHSLAEVVNRIVATRRKTDAVVLIGYSGGGTITWLMAKHIPAATAVVTVAANLDVAAWTTLHDFTPLAGSLDPAKEAPLPQRIRQVHMVGGRDSNVPPALTRSVAVRQADTKVIEIAAFDHVCCWIERWPGLLKNAFNDAPE